MPVMMRICRGYKLIWGCVWNKVGSFSGAHLYNLYSTSSRSCKKKVVVGDVCKLHTTQIVCGDLYVLSPLFSPLHAPFSFSHNMSGNQNFQLRYFNVPYYFSCLYSNLSLYVCTTNCLRIPKGGQISIHTRSKRKHVEDKRLGKKSLIQILDCTESSVLCTRPMHLAGTSSALTR